MTITEDTRPALGLPQIQSLAAADMAAVDALIRRRLSSDVVLINQIADHIISAGGKRLRPMLVMLAGHAVGQAGPEHHQLAAIIEFIHTSTLLHDDVVDESSLRRGRSTANALWGNAPSVLVGDFLYSRSFQLMVELERMPVMQILADATNRIAEAARLSVGSLYQYFPHKQALLDALVARHVTDARTTLDAEFADLRADPPDPVTAVLRIADTAVGLHADHPRLHALFTGFATRTPGGVAVVDALREDCTREVAFHLSRRPAGEDPGEPSAQPVAHRRGEQDVQDLRGEGVQHVLREVLTDRAVSPGETVDQLRRVGAVPQGQ